MPGRGVALGLRRELRLLQFGVGRHAALAIAARQVEHREVQAVEAGQGHELEAVAHASDLALERGDLLRSELLLPVEARRAVVGQHLARELLVDLVGEALGFVQVRLRRLPPQEIGIGRVGQAAGDRIVVTDAGLDAEEAFRRALAADERAVALVDVAGQELRRLRVSAAQQHRVDAFDVGRQAGRVQGTDVMGDRHQHLAAEMAALLLRGELVLEVHACGAGSDHVLHQLVGVQRATEARFGISDDRRHPVGAVLAALGRRDLVATAQRIVDAAHDLRHRVDRIERLVGVHLAAGVGVAGHLPARKVDRLETRLDLLDGLVAGECAQGRHEGFGLQEMAQARGAHLRERMADAKGAGKTLDVGAGVIAADAGRTLRVAAGAHAVRAMGGALGRMIHGALL